MKLVIRILGGVVLAFLMVLTIGWGPYLLGVQHFEASPPNGYQADFYLYVSPAAQRSAQKGQEITILVQPNNSGINSDDPEVHHKDAWLTGFERHRSASELGVVLLVPAFVRPGTDSNIYTHALERDTLTTARADLKRIDRQLIARLDRARAELAKDGIADLEALTGVPLDSVAYHAIPQLIYMGSADANDSLDYTDGWDEADAKLIDRLFGTDPLSRWDDSQAIYQEVGANVQFFLVAGVGHDRKALQKYSTDFFKQVLHDE